MHRYSKCIRHPEFIHQFCSAAPAWNYLISPLTFMTGLTGSFVEANLWAVPVETHRVNWDLQFVIFRHLILHTVIMFPVAEKSEHFFGSLACHNFWTPTAKKLPFEVRVTREYSSLLSKFEPLSSKLTELFTCEVSDFSFFRFLANLMTSLWAAGVSDQLPVPDFR